MLEQPNGFGPGFDARGWGKVNFGGGKTPAEFFYKPKEIASNNGVRQFKDIPAIRFYMAGGTMHEAFVTEQHKTQYPEQWAQFMNKQQQVGEGTPLEHWTLISPAEVATFKAANIPTVQALANAPQPTIQACGMGAINAQIKAQKWLKGAAKTEEITKIVAENANLRSEVDILKKQLAELSIRIGGVTAVGHDNWPNSSKDAEK